MKVPPHEHEGTLHFYREVIGLPELTPSDSAATSRFDFSDKVLWIDKVETCTHAELWLEVTHPDPEAAATFLKETDVVRCDGIELLPAGFSGFWIANPCNIVHLVSGESVT
ncbi:MAG: hypothetical protein AAF921_21225 [Cyanobacteria bacterium P01_D01_bin.44]